MWEQAVSTAAGDPRVTTGQQRRRRCSCGVQRHHVRGLYSVGVAASLCLSLASLLFFAGTLLRLLAAATTASPRAAIAVAGQHVTPLVPGVTVPLSQWPYFFIALFVSVVVHEAGHAAAAVCERVDIQGFGAWLAVVVPGAFVRISASLEHRPVATQLRVLCAGAWHNLLLAALCVLAVPYLPWLLLPLYSLHTGSADGGVMVSSVPPSSPLSTVLTPGDIILSVNFQAVGDTAQWQAAVAGLQQPQGWCVPRDSLAAVTVSSAADAPVYVSGTVAATTTSADDSQCCLQHYRGGHVCFDVLPSADGGSDANSTVRAVCGKASSLVSVATGSCLVSNPSACERDSGSVCVAASSVVYAGASAVVLHTQRRGAVPLLVSPLQLSAAVNVADLRPRAALRWLADAAPRPLECVRDAVFAAPTAAVMVTQAVAIVSISMAVFNVLPVWHFDGQLASACIARAYMRRRYGPPTDADARAAGVVATVANTCTAVVAVTVLASLVSSLSSSAG